MILEEAFKEFLPHTACGCSIGCATMTRQPHSHLREAFPHVQSGGDPNMPPLQPSLPELRRPALLNRMTAAPGWGDGLMELIFRGRKECIWNSA